MDQLTKQLNDRETDSKSVIQTIQNSALIICLLVLTGQGQQGKVIGDPSVLDMVITHLESFPKLPLLSDPRDSECNSSLGYSPDN